MKKIKHKADILTRTHMQIPSNFSLLFNSLLLVKSRSHRYNLDMVFKFAWNNDSFLPANRHNEIDFVGYQVEVNQKKLPVLSLNCLKLTYFCFLVTTTDMGLH